MKMKLHKSQFAWQKSPGVFRKALCELLAALMVFSGPVSVKSSTLIVSALSAAFWVGDNHAVGGNPDGTGNPMNGGPQNPGNQNGGGAGEILLGIAAIVAAIAPMVVAGIESQKEQNVAKIQADAQITQAEIQTGTQKELANLSSQTALKQAEASREVAQMNNDAQTQRLQINLAYAQQQRNDERQAQAEQIQYQRQAEAQKIALAERQADEVMELARQNREAQNLQTALGGGSTSSAAATTTNSMSPLASSLVGTGASTIGASTKGSASSSTGLISAGSANSISGVLPMARGLFESAPASNGKEQPASNRLLASVDTNLTNLEGVAGLQTILKRTPKAKGFGMPRTSVLGKRGLVAKPLQNGRGLYANGSDPRVGGTYPESLSKKKAFAEYAATTTAAPVLVGERLNSDRFRKGASSSSH